MPAGETEDKHGFLKGCALIRSNLHIDPLAGSDEDWAANYAQALWLEDWRLDRQRKMIVSLFAEQKGNT